MTGTFQIIALAPINNQPTCLVCTGNGNGKSSDISNSPPKKVYGAVPTYLNNSFIIIVHKTVAESLNKNN